ncbi:MAG: hypothetical protein ACP5HX_10770 [Thermoproteota archaeon]
MRYINLKGQVIIIISLFFAIAILAVAVLAYMSLSKTQTLFYYPYKEIVESISTDFYNALTNILAITTQIYNQTAEIDSPRRNASQLFTFWYQAVQRTYSSRGLNINTSFDTVKLQSSKNIWGVNLPELYVYNLTKLYWYAPQAISAVEASLYINSAQYQFYGWKTKVLVFLNATIQLPTIKNDGSTVSFNLIVLNERGPVNDLTNSNVVVWYFDPTVTANTFPWKKANVTLSYFGNGNYSVTFSPDLYQKSDSRFWNYYYKFILVQVKDNRGIIVEAYSYSGIEYTITENAIEQFYPNNPNKKYETYLFELLPNGTLYWFEWPLNSGINSPPIPIPPVKQIRVYTTVDGPNSKFIEAPYQVELWKNDYSFPTPKFAEWRRRILAGSKIAFLVNFPPGVRQKNVKITWLYDSDVYPPSYKINMSASGPFVDVYNGIYTLRLVANRSLSYWIDYSINLTGNGYHTEYTLFGYDAYKVQDGSYWLPDKIPGGNWTVLVGPIRAVAFRNSTVVMEYPTKKVYTDELSHSMIISIPYNVTYFTWSFRGKWLKSVTLNNPYLTYIGMISGTNNDYDTNLRTNWGSLNSTRYSVVVNGSFSDYNYIEHRARGLNDYTYGNWLALYREGFGTTLFASNELINALKVYNKDQAWVWTTNDYQRRVMEYDAIYFGSSSPATIEPGSFYVKAAGMLYNGGSANYFYSDWNIWYRDDDSSVWAFQKSTGVEVPLMYYKMFTGANNPTVSNVQIIYTPILP